MTNGRTKGHDAEREIVKLLADLAPLKRNLQQTQEGGYDLIGLDFLALEIKRCESLQIEAWWKQTLRQARCGQTPVLLYRQNRKPWQAVMMAKIENTDVRATISFEDFRSWLTKRLATPLSAPNESALDTMLQRPPIESSALS